MNLTIPSALKGVSNGLLIATIDNGNGTKTWQWRSSYPISTYLVSVAISNYVTWTDFYVPVTGGPAMPVQHWVYPEHEIAARQDFSVTVPQLEFFSNLFGEYPFVTEKYGHAIFASGGAMEHQTVTSYDFNLIRGDNRYDWIVAHEMGHQWFGDSVGPAIWNEIWLNEGFASYTEALWQEHLFGAPALRSYMASLDTRPFCGPVYAPTCGLFSDTVYNKGAWVLHMLRGVMGDADFFDGMRDYVAAFEGGSATTNGFRAIMETASGQSLTTFFNNWVFSTGNPTYQWGWSTAQTPAGWIAYVHVQQTQAGAVFATADPDARDDERRLHRGRAPEHGARGGLPDRPDAQPAHLALARPRQLDPEDGQYDGRHRWRYRWSARRAGQLPHGRQRQPGEPRRRLDGRRL